MDNNLPDNSNNNNNNNNNSNNNNNGNKGRNNRSIMVILVISILLTFLFWRVFDRVSSGREEEPEYRMTVWQRSFVRQRQNMEQNMKV